MGKFKLRIRISRSKLEKEVLKKDLKFSKSAGGISSTRSLYARKSKKASSFELKKPDERTMIRRNRTKSMPDRSM